MSAIQIAFDDAYLEGVGVVHVEDGRLAADGPILVERGDVLYLRLESGTLFSGLIGGDRYIGVYDRHLELEPGDYLICRGGLYTRIQVEALT